MIKVKKKTSSGLNVVSKESDFLPGGRKSEPYPFRIRIKKDLSFLQKVHNFFSATYYVPPPHKIYTVSCITKNNRTFSWIRTKEDIWGNPIGKY
jgi:hypothetical protein